MHSVYIDDAVRASQRLFADLLSERCQGTVAELLEAQSHRLLAAHQRSDEAVVAHLTCWCPDRISRGKETLELPLTLELARATMAREHGYGDWGEVLASATEARFDPLFEHAADCVVHGELDLLRALLAQRPDLATARSPFGHRATLLHYVGANGVETYRQCAPLNAPQVAQLLLDAGADPAAEASMYGGATTLELVQTSEHPHRAGTTKAIVEVLQSAGCSQGSTVRCERR
jgi:hypothetical protein